MPEHKAAAASPAVLGQRGVTASGITRAYCLERKAAGAWRAANACFGGDRKSDVALLGSIVASWRASGIAATLLRCHLRPPQGPRRRPSLFTARILFEFFYGEEGLLPLRAWQASNRRLQRPFLQ